VTLESTMRASAALPRHRLWAIGRDERAGGTVDFEITWEDFERDTGWAITMLGKLGVHRGSAVLVVAHIAEAPWFDPFEHAVLALGGHFSLGENQPFDAFRAAMYGRRLSTELVLGLNRSVAETIGDDLGDAFSQARLVLARPDAVPLVAAAGLPAAVVTRIGPALAVECAPGSGAHVNPSMWAVEAEEGELELTSISERGYELNRERVGVRGTIRTDTCECRMPGPRVDVDSSRSW